MGDALRDPSLPADVIVTRMHDRGIARSLAIFAVQAVMRHHLRVDDYAAQQRDQIWRCLGVPSPTDLGVAVLGLGVIGRRIAAAFATMDYRVAGLSRTPKTVDGIATVYGPVALTELLRGSDYVVAALPETDGTVGLLYRTIFATMKQGSVVVNVGRGSLIVEEDLVDALNSGHLGGAVLDVTSVEPLPVCHPLWSHSKVSITPRSGGPSSGSGTTLFDDLAANYARLIAGEPLHGIAERERGY